MPYAIGTLELLALFALAAASLLLFLSGGARSRWIAPWLICVALAIVVSPADLLSTLVMSAAFCGVFTFGVRYRSLTLSTTR